MSSPLLLLRGGLARGAAGAPSVLVVHSGRADQLVSLVADVRRDFPGSDVTIVVREADRGVVADLRGSTIEVSRYGEVPALLRRLRRRPFELAVVQIGVPEHGELKLLPLWLRVRRLEACDPSLRRFPVRWSTLGRFVGGLSGRGAGSVGEGLARAALRVVETPAGAGVVVGSAAWLHARGLVRRWLRRGHALPSAPGSGASSTPDAALN